MDSSIDNIESFGESRTEAARFLKEVTEETYSFVLATVRIWGDKDSPEEHGEFYQLMPEGNDVFFDWYIATRPYHQFHKSKEMAVVYFLKYWIIWDTLGRPTYQDYYNGLR